MGADLAQDGLPSVAMAVDHTGRNNHPSSVDDLGAQVGEIQADIDDGIAVNDDVSFGQDADFVVNKIDDPSSDKSLLGYCVSLSCRCWAAELLDDNDTMQRRSRPLPRLYVASR
ncbi:hypothetical protein [Salinibacterium sp.]|uniref:hypothetical protein n=1 Tax=Salinibacterium sp. TaxID=1915057 RepID=UPI00286B98CF|nr:hypothetical protein [Salinibacterium sp.]